MDRFHRPNANEMITATVVLIPDTQSTALAELLPAANVNDGRIFTPCRRLKVDPLVVG